MNKFLHMIGTNLHFLIVPFLCFYALEYYTHDPWKMATTPQIINYLIFFMLLIAISSLTGRKKLSVVILVIFSAVIGMANYFVMAFRNNPILPWDIQSFSTAMKVADNYKFEMNSRFYISTGVLALLLLLTIILSIYIRKKPTPFCGLKCRIAGFLLSFACIILIMTGMMNDRITKELLTPTNLFTQWASYRDNGFMVSFMQNLQYMKIKKPQGYNAKKLDEELQTFINEYKANNPDNPIFSNEDSSVITPDIIVIMNESFADLSVLHDFSTDVDYMPNIHAYQKTDAPNLITGNLFVSVLGGNTANTEFEFLTGGTTAFLPSGSIPYQQYISSSLTSLASILSPLGYHSAGIHPYNASGWNRNKVYPYMGFEKTFFKEAFSGAEILRKYISDKAAFDKLKELTEATPDASHFLFEVTMQNHGGYTDIFDNCPLQVTLTDINSSTNSGTENYLTLVKKSDEAFAELIRYYSNQTKPTIILMFGDHQPNDYVSEKVAALTGVPKDKRDFEELQNRYIVPYVIWANFPLKKEKAGLTGLAALEKEGLINENTLSPNYLGACLMKLSGNDPTLYQEFLLILKEELPVLTANVAIDKDGNYMTIDEVKKKYPKLLNLYQKLQYRELFDKSY